MTNHADLIAALRIPMNVTLPGAPELDEYDEQRKAAADALEDLLAEVQEMVANGHDLNEIEGGGKRWHGTDHRVIHVRWEPYKPDGQRQMKARGRWQEQVGSGDYWRWQNCDPPKNLRQLRSRPSDQGERR